MREQIAQAIQAALQGSRKVRIIFKRGATSDVKHLIAMARAGILSLGKDLMNLEAVAVSGEWESGRNRTTVVTLTDTFDQEWFVGRMERALEKIKVVS